MWLFVVVVVVVVDRGDNDDGVRAQPEYDDGPGLWRACCYIIHALLTRERCIHRANNNYYLFVYIIKEKNILFCTSAPTVETGLLPLMNVQRAYEVHAT